MWNKQNRRYFNQSRLIWKIQQKLKLASWNPIGMYKLVNSIQNKEFPLKILSSEHYLKY